MIHPLVIWEFEISSITWVLLTLLSGENFLSPCLSYLFVYVQNVNAVFQTVPRTLYYCGAGSVKDLQIFFRFPEKNIKTMEQKWVI
jgi:hypothetical protein